MKYALSCVALLFLLGRPASAQIGPIGPEVKDCSNCANASWGAEYNPSTGGCAVNPSMGCGNGCNCWMGFQAVVTVSSDAAAGVKSKIDFFGGAFTKDGGFRIDRPGPLARNHVKAGDVVYRVNSRRPKRSQFGTTKRPIRRAEATWGDDGKLRLRFYY